MIKFNAAEDVVLCVEILSAARAYSSAMCVCVASILICVTAANFVQSANAAKIFSVSTTAHVSMVVFASEITATLVFKIA